MNRVVAAKRDRLLTVIGRREQGRDELSLVRRLHADVVAAETIRSGAKLEAQHQRVTNAAVQAQYAAWCGMLRARLEDTDLDATERPCLEHVLHVTTNMDRAWSGAMMWSICRAATIIWKASFAA